MIKVAIEDLEKNIPSFHRDPFDRMLICQAIEHKMTIVTMDEAIAKYPIKILP